MLHIYDDPCCLKKPKFRILRVQNKIFRMSSALNHYCSIHWRIKGKGKDKGRKKGKGKGRKKGKGKDKEKGEGKERSKEPIY